MIFVLNPQTVQATYTDNLERLKIAFSKLEIQIFLRHHQNSVKYKV